MNPSRILSVSPVSVTCTLIGDASSGDMHELAFNSTLVCYYFDNMVKELGSRYFH